MALKNINTFSYSDVIFSFSLNEDMPCAYTPVSHFILYVHSGEMYVKGDGFEMTAERGDCLFIKKGNTITFNKHSVNGEPYQGIVIMFKHNNLKVFYNELNISSVFKGTLTLESSCIKLGQSPDLESLFYSLVPYINSADKPHKELMELKVKQALFTLLSIDERFHSILFDFTSEYKIDILKFLNLNYMCDLTVEEMAVCTGRSLASFKRDFKKLSPLSPQKWLMKRRLDEAYNEIKNEESSVAQVCFAVGFKNRAHFTTAFKKEFGVTPSKLRDNQD